MRSFLILIFLISVKLVLNAQCCNNKGLVVTVESARRCTGNSYCTSCTNCDYCNWCNSGGSCGVCSKSKPSSPKKITMPSYKTPKYNNSGNSYYKMAEYRTVNAKILNLRSEPNTQSKIIKVLSFGDILQVEELTDKNWAKVSYFDVNKMQYIYGYVYRKYIL